MLDKIKKLIDIVPVDKKYWIPGLIILILILLLVFTNTNRTNYRLPKLVKIDKDSITKLEITENSNVITLVKDTNQWLIEPEKYKADNVIIDDFLKILTEFKITDLVSESGNYLRYEITSNKKINVKAYNNEIVIRDFDIGKVAPTYRHTFIKIANRTEVYNAKGNFRNQFSKKIEDLRDKNIFKFNQNEIKSVQLINKAGQKLNITKSETIAFITNEDKNVDTKNKIEWKTENGKNIKESELNAILNGLSSLRCEGFINDKKKEAFKAPIYSITVNNTLTYHIRIYRKKDDKYPAVTDSRNYAFLLSSYNAERIMKKFAALYE